MIQGNVYIDFVRYCLGQGTFDHDIKDDRAWELLYAFCRQQSLLGIGQEGVKRLMDEKNMRPPRTIMLRWYSIAERIKKANQQVNANAVAFTHLVETDGMRCCVLKGQGNNLMYPTPWSRNPGDIDAWLCVPDAKDGIDRIISYVKQVNPKGVAGYHHVDLGKFQGTEVEVHYRPAFMFNPLHNHRLQKWFVNHGKEQFNHRVELPGVEGAVSVPLPEFNVVFQLSHIYNHTLHEGIGLRQFIDYNYVLKTLNPSEDCKYHCQQTLKYLGLWKIAGAVMWVLSEVLGLEERYLIAQPDATRGKALLMEIVRGGNFGKFAKENRQAKGSIDKNLLRLKRDWRMTRHFPSETLWEPVFRLYHFFWRQMHN